MSMTTAETKTALVLPLREGRVAIPAEFQRALGIEEGSALRLTLQNGELRITPARASETTDRSDWFRQLYDYFAPARAEALEKGYTEEQINAWIDEAVAEVRAKRG
jgi:AbrB family looped-hinge helix DNA binding protein